MKAITYDSYGSPDILTLTEVDTPVPGADELLVQVHAAGINPYDWHLYRGEPYLVRPSSGWRSPRERATVGTDFAGEVVAVGANVEGYERGDRVYGEVGLGACAEYLVAKAADLAPMPASVTYEQAAALPMGALTAYQGLRDTAHLQPGQSVLVNGASGGVGHMAVQIAKAMGAAHVTAVCSAKNAHWLRGIGADAVVDYTSEDFTLSGQRYDVVYDTAGGHSVRSIRRALQPKGCYALAGSTGRGKLLGPASHMFGSMVGGLFVSQKVGLVTAAMSSEDLARIADWVDSGDITPVIDRTYPLAQTADAFRYLEEGHVAGKVVIAVTAAR